MKKSYMTLIELYGTMSVMAIMFTYSGITWSSALKTQAKLEKSKAQSMSIERTADIIRSLAANFTTETEIFYNQVQSGLLILKVDKNSLTLTNIDGIKTIILPEGTSIRFLPYKSIRNEPMLITEILVKNGNKKNTYMIKSELQ